MPKKLETRIRAQFTRVAAVLEHTVAMAQPLTDELERDPRWLEADALSEDGRDHEAECIPEYYWMGALIDDIGARRRSDGRGRGAEGELTKLARLMRWYADMTVENLTAEEAKRERAKARAKRRTAGDRA